MNVCFVILHYQNLDITKKSIYFLQKLKKIEECHVIIVDNCSPNRSGQLLKEEFKDVANLLVILNKENLGFAAGNNVGYRYAKNVFKAQQIIIMNNDVFIEDEDFILKIMNESNQNYQLIAPDIVNSKGMHQNPFRNEKLNDKKLNKIYKYNSFLFVVYSIPLINIIFLYLLKFYKLFKNRIITKKIHYEKKYFHNIVPHGSCIIYQRKWIEQEEEAFISGTFMYFEEDILYEYAMEKEYIIKYVPSIQVQHLEDASINASKKSEISKRVFIAKHMKKSTNVLKKIRSKKEEF